MRWARPRWAPDEVLRDADFRRLWVGHAVSQLGSQVTALALPLVAALTLGASTFQVGLLAFATQAPFLLVSLPAGVLVDRVRRRPLVVATDLASGVLLLSVPVAALADRLTFAQLVAVAFGVGVCAAVGQVAHFSYVPSLVPRDRLVAANSRIQVNYSAAEAAGPGLGGVLVQVLSAPVALVLDALSFLLSGLLTARIRRPEPVPPRPATPEPFARVVGEGMRFLLGHPALRVVMLVSVGNGLAGGAFLALLVYYLATGVGLGAAAIGLVFAAGGLAAIPGAVAAERVARRVGLGRTIVGGWLVENAMWVLVPLAAGPTALVVATLALAQAVRGAAGTVANIHQWTLRQTVTPGALHGRVTAAQRFLVFGSSAVGALLGGALGSAVGVRRAMLGLAVANVLVCLPAVGTALWRLRERPAGPEPLPGASPVEQAA